MGKAAPARRLHIVPAQPAPNRLRRPKTSPQQQEYPGFSQLDGRHPFANAVPGSCVHYQVRQLNEGKIAYFNFTLAKEMGLLSKNHAHRLNANLEKKLIECFSLRIINEYDIKRRNKFPRENIRQYPYMATRYLQLQHKNRKGQTSGDGRSIWNGVVRHNGKIWDVSSRGTGVTCLAPGFVEAGKPLKTGGTEFGYGCGTADVDELIGAALMSEIYHRKGIGTERVLAVIDLGNGIGIGVRAGMDLFRPAHLFALLKQNRKNELRKAVEFVMNRQVQNSRWKIRHGRGHKYDQMLHYLARDFAWFAARLEIEYMFVWLDWDGDNVLLDPGIIDYGSVRQFGLFHDTYRYDDVDRYSTCLSEQRKKARETIQTFIQMLQYLKGSRKSEISKYKNHWAAKLFDREFNQARLKYFLTQIGWDETSTNHTLKKKYKQVEQLFKLARHFELKTTKRKTEKLPDGIIRPAIFNMRSLWRQLPKALINSKFLPVSEAEFFDMMLAQSARGTDLKYFSAYSRGIRKTQELYMDLIESLPGKWSQNLEKIKTRAALTCRLDRITGNSVECITQEILSAHAKGLPQRELQKVMESLIQNQVGPTKGQQLILFDNPQARNLLEKAQRILTLYCEDI